MKPKEMIMKVVDPVCKMTIDDKKAAGSSEREGKKYYFCSGGCKARFEKDPEKYVSKAS